MSGTDTTKPDAPCPHTHPDTGLPCFLRGAHPKHRTSPADGNVPWKNENYEVVRATLSRASAIRRANRRKTPKADPERMKEMGGGSPEQLLPPEMQAHARSTDPETSHEAAAKSSMTMHEHTMAVLGLFREHGPMTHETLERVARDAGVMRSESGLRTRCKQLVDLGLVRESGRFEITPFNNRTTVWEATPIPGQRADLKVVS